MQQSPYIAHVFVCVNDREGARKSCADGGDGVELRARLKAAVAARGWKPRVRVSSCGCMGLCAEGPNVIIYPQKTWFSAVAPDDFDAVMQAIEKILDQSPMQ